MLDFKRDVRVIEENDAEGSAIIFVNDSGSDVDEILGGQAGSKNLLHKLINIKMFVTILLSTAHKNLEKPKT